MKKISEKTLIIVTSLLVIILTGAVGAMYFKYHKTENKYTYIKATRGDLTEEIKTDGTVKAAEEIDLAFERSGKIQSANLKVGDKVSAGQVLARLDTSDLNADISQSAASVAMAQSQLEQLQAAVEMQKIKKEEMLKGAKPEEIQVAETKRDNAKAGLRDAETNLQNVKDKAQADYSSLVDNISDLLNDAYNKSFDAVYRQTNDMFNNSNMDNPLLAYNTPLNTDYKLTVESKRRDAQKAVEALSGLSRSILPDYSNYTDIANQTTAQLAIVSDYLMTLNNSLNYTVVSTDLPASTVNLYKSNISVSETNINSITPSISTYRQSVGTLKVANGNLIEAARMKINDAQNALKVAEDQLVLARSGATAEQLAAQDVAINQAMASVKTQQAQIDAVRANANKVSSQLDKAIIKSPINGTLTRFDLKAGELAAPGTPVIGVMSDAKYQIESFLPENALTYIKVGNKAEVSLDEGGNGRTYGAKIISIDPAATMVNGNPTYKAVLEFDKIETAIKPGLTANVRIMARQEKDILIIPATSVIKDANNDYVIVDNGKNGEKHTVQIGELNVNGNVGVRSGLSESDKIAAFGSAQINK